MITNLIYKNSSTMKLTAILVSFSYICCKEVFAIIDRCTSVARHSLQMTVSDIIDFWFNYFSVDFAILVFNKISCWAILLLFKRNYTKTLSLLSGTLSHQNKL